MIHVLTFDASGNGRCLYTEHFDLNTIGKLEIRRASEIEFNNQMQQWEVRNPENQILYSNPSRTMCLTWEYQFFNR
jgi:hypothetical protein